MGCIFKAKTTDREGNVTDSKFFEDLLKYTGDRKSAIEHYAVGKSQDFLQQFSAELEFDENNEVTFKSYQKVTGFTLDKDRVLNELKKDVGEGTFEYNDAVQKVQDFNKNNPMSDDYMATMIEDEKGKVFVTVVERTPSSQSELETFVENRGINDFIRYKLAELGVSTGFLEGDNSRIYGKYSTANAKTTYGTFVNLINIAHNEQGEESLCEETGHFIVGAMTGTPLMTRLIEACSTLETKREVFGNDFTSKADDPMTQSREVAGVLIGKYLKKDFGKSGLRRLIERIMLNIQEKFQKLTTQDAKAQLTQAKIYAKKVAANFMEEGKFAGTLENAMKTEETLYNAKVTSRTVAFKEIQNGLQKLRNKLEEVDPNISKFFENIAKSQIMTLRSSGANTTEESLNSENVNFEVAKFQAAIDSLSSIITAMSELQKDIENINFENVADFKTSMMKYAKFLNISTIITKQTASILDSLRNSVPELLMSREHALESEDPMLIYFTEIYDKIVDMVNPLKANSFSAMIRNKNLEFFTKFLEEGYGKNYIDMSKHVVLVPLFNRRGKESVEAGKKMTIRQLVEVYDNGDIGLFDRFLRTASNCDDIVMQIVDKISKAAHKNADDRTQQVQLELLQLERELSQLGKTSEIFYEKIYDENGNFQYTGNFISEFKTGEAEKDFLKMKKEAREKFYEENPQYKGMSDMEIGLLWEGFFKSYFKEYRRANPDRYKWNEDLNKFELGDYYKNPEFEQFKADRQVYNIYKRLIELKQSIDKEALPEGSTSELRVPQMTATFTNRLRNRKLAGVKHRFWYGLREKFHETFCVSCEMDEFGNDLTYNDPEEALYNNELNGVKSSPNRICTYGINRLKDMNTLSTDIFSSMLAYANMAYTYHAMSTIADGLEVGRYVYRAARVNSKIITAEKYFDNVINENGKVKKNRTVLRKILNQKDKFDDFVDRGEVPRCYSKYCDFIDKQVYGHITNPIAIGFSGMYKLSLRKFFSELTGLASKMWLGGNVHGGLVNLGTGFGELFKEAVSGEHFTLKEFAKAHAAYYSSFFDEALDTITSPVEGTLLGKHQVGTSKVALMQKMFNTRGDNSRHYRNWHIENQKFNYPWIARAGFIFGENLMLSYSAGDHFMQNMGYIAQAQKRKVYYNDGSETNLWDAYKPVSIQSYTVNNSGDIVPVKFPVQTLIPLKDGEVEYYEKLIAAKNIHELMLEHSNNTNGKALLDKLGITLSLSEINNELYKRSTLYKNKEGKEMEGLIVSIQNKLTDVMNTGVNTINLTINSAGLTQEEQKYLIDNKYITEVLADPNDPNSKQLLISDISTTYNALSNDIGNNYRWGSEDESKFMDKCREVNNRMHGVYNMQDKTSFQRNLIGGMLLAMKGYVLGMGERRLGRGQYNVALDEYVEGSYLTMAKVLCYKFDEDTTLNFMQRVARRSRLVADSSFLVFSKNGNERLSNLGFSQNQIANMKRNAMDACWGALLWIGQYLMSKACFGKDKDDDDELWAMTYYMLHRLALEQTSWIWPSDIKLEWSNFMDLTPPGLSALLSLGEMSWYLITGATYKSGQKKGQSKFVDKLIRTLPYAKSIRVWNGAFTAAEAYDYGRRIRG